MDYVRAKGFQRLYFLRMLKRAGVEPKDPVRICVSLVRSVPECACQVWHTGLTVGLQQSQSDQLKALQRRALRIAYPDNSYRESLLLTGLDTSYDRRTALASTFFADMLRPSHNLHHLIIIPLQRAHRDTISGFP